MYTSANVTLMVSEFNRAVSFYTDTLALKLKVRHGADWAEVRRQVLRSACTQAVSAPPRPSRPLAFSIGLGVTGIEQVVADLEAKGVRLAPPGIIDTGVERLANFHDPDQTPLYLYEMSHH